MEQIKKYIRGNTKRGHEVIAELEKLGGKNALKLKGNEYDKIYYIAGLKYSDFNTIDFVSEKSLIGQLIVTHSDWEEIELPKIFKDGDVVTYKHENGLVSMLLNKFINFVELHYHCALYDNANGFATNNYIIGEPKYIRFATEEEREKLFKAIKDNGYKWNAETKTLERLIVPKFKVGGKIVKRDSIDNSWIVSSVGSEYYGLQLPKGSESIGILPVCEQDDYELLPNKFDISTLKPFERVLVRYNKDNKWCGSFFSHIDKEHHSHCYKYVTAAGKSYPYCIPFEGNQHLLGTTNDCDNFYKTWE